MSTESQTPTDATGSAPSSRRAMTIAAVAFAVVTAAALTWAKWWPYAGRIERVLASHAFGGTSILTDGTAAPPAPSWRSAWHFTVSYFDSVWIALVAALLISAATDALLPRRWLVRQLARGPKWTGGAAAGGLASLPSMMCTCWTAPLSVTLRRRGVPPASALAYWVGNPTLNPAVLVFLAVVLPWQWVGVRVLGGLVLVFVITAVAAKAGGRQPVAPTWSESDLADEPMALLPTLRRFGVTLGRLALTLLPEYLVIVFAVGAVRGWLFPTGGQLAAWGAVGVAVFAVAGTLFVIPTAGEIPIIQGVLAAGVGAGPAGALLITLPALSLPSLIMVARSFSRRTLAIVTAGVVLLGVGTGAALAAISG